MGFFDAIGNIANIGTLGIGGAITGGPSLGDSLGNVLGTKNKYGAQPANIGDQQVPYYNQINPLIQQNQDYINALREQSQGRGPNLAEAELRKASNQNLQQQASMLGSTRGINPALAARYIGQQGSVAGQQTAADAGLLRLQQQLAAQNALGGQLGSSINTYGQLQNAQNGQNLNNYWNAQNINSGIAAQNTATNNQITGGLINAGGAFLGKSAGGTAPMPMGPGYEAGGEIPGEPQYPGNDERNDIVDIKASKGEIVLPNSITQNPNAPEMARNFVAAIQASHKPNEKVEYKHVLDHHKRMKEYIERMCMGGYT